MDGFAAIFSVAGELDLDRVPEIGARNLYSKRASCDVEDTTRNELRFSQHGEVDLLGEGIAAAGPRYGGDLITCGEALADAI